MPIHVPAEATCDHCGKTEPCKLAGAFGNHGIKWSNRGYEELCVATRGLAGWFWKEDGIACSEPCRDVLAKDPKHAAYGGRWTAFPG
jgi:hypothetical protein